MKAAETISVDPGRLTAGALYSTGTKRIISKAAGAINVNVAVTSKKKVSDFLFASYAPGAYRYGIRILVFRCIWSAILIAYGVMLFTGTLVSPNGGFPASQLGVAIGTVGVIMLLGIMTRPVSLVATVVCGAWAVEGISGGVFSLDAFSTTLVFLIFAVSGPGKFSSDFLIKKSLYRRAIRHRNRRREDRLSYKAFSTMQ